MKKKYFLIQADGYASIHTEIYIRIHKHRYIKYGLRIRIYVYNYSEYGGMLQNPWVSFCGFDLLADQVDSLFVYDFFFFTPGWS